MIDHPWPVDVPVPATAPVPASAKASGAPAKTTSKNLVEKTSAPAPKAVEGFKQDSIPAKLNYNYTYSGPDENAPTQVYDDGNATYVKFASMPAKTPNVFIVTPEGNEVPAKYSVRSDAIVVDTIAAELILRGGKTPVYIYNELLEGK